MNKITDSTCNYGLARTKDGCVHTLASLAPTNYERIQILDVTLGLVALCVASYKFVRSVHNQGAKLQKSAFLWSMYASITFVVRGIDPMSYGHFIPRPIGHFIVDSCTAAICTVFIMTLESWVSIVHMGRQTPEVARRIRLLKYVSIAAVWLIKIASNVALLWSKGFDSYFADFELVLAIVMAIVLCVFFGIYGLRVIRRLEYIDLMHARRVSLETYFDSLHTTRIDFGATGASRTSTVLSYTDIESQRQDSIVPSIAPPPKKPFSSIPRPPRLRKRKPARKIKEMLIVTEFVALLCIIAQIVSGIQHHRNYKELACANGFECDRITSNWPLNHALQYVTIWCVLFTFRKTKRDKKAASALGLTQPQSLV